MSFRITQSILSRVALANVNRQQQRLAVSQERASSGLAINRPSDDPAGAAAALLLRASLEATAQFQRNVSQARHRVAAVESALSDAGDALIRARELAIQGSNGTLDPGSRVLIAREVEALHQQLLADANTKASGSHLFAGFSSDAPPFVTSGLFVDGSPSPITSFVGESSLVATEIDEGVTVATTLDGRRVFLGDADGNGSPDAGREDIFDVLADLRDALMANDQAAVAASMPRLDRARDQLGLARTEIGVVDAKLASWQQRLSDRELRLETGLSDVQDADAAEIFSDLTRQQVALEAALETMGRIIQPSLMDFID